MVPGAHARNPQAQETQKWVLKQRGRSPLQKQILDAHFGNITHCKEIRLEVGKRGRGDIRNLLIQGAQAVLRMGKHTTMGQWGWKLFARKGNRNVAAIARKMLVQVWHLLNGHSRPESESVKSFTAKLQKLAVVLGTTLRTELNLGKSVAQCVCLLRQRCMEPVPSPAS